MSTITISRNRGIEFFMHNHCIPVATCNVVLPFSSAKQCTQDLLLSVCIE